MIIISFLLYMGLASFNVYCDVPVSCEEKACMVMEILQSGAHQDYIGEPVSQLEHALQCAQLAQNDGADDEVVLAALLHDIGHICSESDVEQMSGYGVMNHEVVGANFVRKLGFSSKVASLIEGHVQAKRYLTYKDHDYYNRLSPASIQTLQFQGGPMTAQEADDFEQDPLFKHKLQMRKWDEQAKRVGWKVTPLESYKTMIVNHLNRNC